jgi:YVTN family beta-propeller protein
MIELPSGTVTFLFTDIEGSTQLVKRLGPTYAQVLSEHQQVVRAAVAAHGGREVDTQGDSFFVAFRRAKDAVAAAVAIQRDLAAHAWPEDGHVRVRIGLHTGEPHVGDERYVGMGVNKAARIGAAGHGGQVLLSRTTRDLVEDELPPGVTIRELGERRLKDLERPEQLSQLVIEGLPDRFAELTTLDVELKRKRRRMYIGAALIGVIAAAVAIPVFALGQGSGESGTKVAPNAVAIVDPASNRVLGSVPVGIRPGPLAADGESGWVGNLDDRTLTRIDVARRAAVATVSLDRRTPTGVAAGAGAVWVAHGRRGELSRVDPQFNQLAQSIRVTAPEGGGGAQQGSVAEGEGSVWAAYGDGTLARIEPSALRGVASTFAGSVPAALVAARGSLWVANSGDSTVSRFDPATFEEGPLRVISVGRRPMGIAYGADAIWVANSGDGTVTRIDPSTYSTATIAVGSRPVSVAADESAVWVSNADDGTLARIDPATNEVIHTIEIGNAPAGVSLADGLVWVAIQAP